MRAVLRAACLSGRNPLSASCPALLSTASYVEVELGIMAQGVQVAFSVEGDQPQPSSPAARARAYALERTREQSVFLVKSCEALGFLKDPIEPLKWEIIKLWFPVNLLFVGMLVSSFLCPKTHWG
ncbi:hypothetical protein QJQ45_024666 [Haematococcus lacustris]|nr:hypothetical protein QJQ45_024666 [Haematococcus lacustris]